jgi:ubiquinone/menaquinone biosynthesis C-methylase UbiE
MANRPSNQQRNQWVVSLFDVQPSERVLEIGFGPGLSIAELGQRVGASGHVYGIDHSNVRLNQAGRRNAAAIRSGRVTLIEASVENLPPALNGPLDAILAVNSLGFWPAPASRLEELRGRLRVGGRIAIVSQPRAARRGIAPGEVARELIDLLEKAGFNQPSTEALDLQPPVVCVLAVNDVSTDRRGIE